MHDRFAAILERLDNVRVLVLGDFLIDEFIFGEIERVSREAPVLILGYRETHRTPGGAANTVAGVDALGARVIPIGYLGNDEWADVLLSLWSPRVNTDYVFKEPGFETTRKSRILAGSFHSFRQQVVRLDYEYAYQLNADQEARILDSLEVLIPATDAIILSDYSLGNVSRNIRQQAIRWARRHGKPVMADSRFDPAGFHGATALTPNISEVEASVQKRVGREDLENLGNQLRLEWGLDALLVTRGKLGMSLFEEQGITHIPIYGSDQVADVTGAGDTVICTFTSAVAAGASYGEAAVLANLAGGIVVSKKGTATVSREELTAAVADCEQIEQWLSKTN